MNGSILEKNDSEPTSIDGQMCEYVIRKIEPKFYVFFNGRILVLIALKL